MIVIHLKNTVKRMIFSREYPIYDLTIYETTGDEVPYSLRKDQRSIAEWQFVAQKDSLKWNLKLACDQVKLISSSQPGFRIPERYSENLEDFIRYALPRDWHWENDGTRYTPIDAVSAVEGALMETGYYIAGGAA